MDAHRLGARVALVLDRRRDPVRDQVVDPDPLAGEALSDSDDRTASWGGVELTCGVEEPEEYDEYAACIEIGGIGWFVPDSELEDLAGDATATALTTTPYVALHVPVEHRAVGVDQMLTELAAPSRGCR